MIDAVSDLIKNIFNATDRELPKYSFVERKFDDEYVQVATKIESGKYSGVVFSVGEVKFSGETQESINLNYQFMVEYCPPDVTIEEGFDNIVGDIIMDVIAKEVASQESEKTS